MGANKMSYIAVYLLLTLIKICFCVDLQFHIPEEVGIPSNGRSYISFHLFGHTQVSTFGINASRLHELIKIDNVVPGTLYTFDLYYSNDTVDDLLVWTADLPTSPDPPVNLTVNVIDEKVAEVTWKPPRYGGYTRFRMSLILHTVNDSGAVRNNYIDDVKSFYLENLEPGTFYEVRLYSVFHDQESSEFVTTNFTTKLTAPGRFVIWFRNETSLLVLWQPCDIFGNFDIYKVMIAPEDALQSEILIKKENEPSMAQAAFHGLVPGRMYNISVRTIKHYQFSEPSTAQYRTVPLAPAKAFYEIDSLTPTSFEVRWDPPKNFSEFDHYQVNLGRKDTVLINKDEERFVTFDDLQPGETYDVIFQTISGDVASWPLAINVTTRPLPVSIISSSSENVGEIFLEWEPSKNSTQDSYRVIYRDEEFDIGGELLVVQNTSIIITDLLPGFSYNISFMAISKNISSEATIIYQKTKSASPVLELLQTADVIVD